MVVTDSAGSADLVPPGSTLSAHRSSLLTEFRRVLGMAMIRANAALKLYRFPFVGRTDSDARHRASEQLPSGRPASIGDAPSFYHCNLRCSHLPCRVNLSFPGTPWSIVLVSWNLDNGKL
uniref:Uncharacterized protein n=1 Tax=Amphora coffeiformis TaxID=265554 RepID=A0A7S3LDD6_9STRA|eukprot:scaffold2917_cov191-Amphora_coffeaeformis.AAC.35